MRRLASCVVWGALSLACLPVWAANQGPKTYGTISYLHLGKLLPASAPAPPLPQIDFRNFTFYLYPTQTDPDLSRAGIPPISADAVAPLVAPVANGIYKRHNDTADPFEFDVIKVEQASLPHAPGKQAAIVFGIFYAGSGTPVCTGVVQVLARREGRIEIEDQITFDCRGGMNAQYIPAKRRLHIVSAVFAAGDPRCCPSMSDTVNFKLEGDRAKASVVALSSSE